MFLLMKIVILLTIHITHQQIKTKILIFNLAPNIEVTMTI